MNVAIAFSDDTISINNVNYKLEDVEGNYIISSKTRFVSTMGIDKYKNSDMEDR